MKQSEKCKRPPSTHTLFHGEWTFSISITAYVMPIPLFIATLSLMPNSALNKSWRYIEGALYEYAFTYMLSYVLDLRCWKLHLKIYFHLKYRKKPFWITLRPCVSIFNFTLEKIRLIGLFLLFFLNVILWG